MSIIDNKVLEELDIGKNNIGSEGGKIIGDMLSKNTLLKKLNLGTILSKLDSNRIGSEGAIAIWYGLKQNDKLISLSLSKNEITQVGMENIPDCLTENSKLKYLDLCIFRLMIYS